MHFYRCNPELNTGCKKDNCFKMGGTCSFTSDPSCTDDKFPLFPDQGWKFGRDVVRKFREENGYENGKSCSEIK